MAGNNDTTQQMVGLQFHEGFTAIADPRRMLAMEAAYEIDALCGILRDVGGEQGWSPRLIVHGISARIEDLARGIVCCLDDEQESLEKLRLRIARESYQDKN